MILLDQEINCDSEQTIDAKDLPPSNKILLNCAEIRISLERTELEENELINVSINFIRNELIPDPQGYCEWTQINFGDSDVKLSYVCDICDAHYPTLNEMNSTICTHCAKCYDYCKVHEHVITCPFC